MVWDHAVGRVVLLTGFDSAIWKWDGVEWTGAGAGPQVAALTGAAYDETNKVLLVLGRESPGPSSPPAYQGDVMWSWDGARWTMSPTPMSWRWEGGVAYDQVHRQLVVHGGFGNGDNRTWLWDGRTWSGVNTSTFPMANQSTAAYDPVRHEVAMYAPGGETWTWDGITWRKRSTTGPGIRRDQSMAFDAAIGKVVLFGGKSPGGANDEVYHNDLWAWDGTAWTQIA